MTDKHHRKTHCLRGHEYSEHARIDKNGHYKCRPCAEERRKYQVRGMCAPRIGFAENIHPRTAALVVDLLVAGARSSALARVPELGLTRRQIFYCSEKAEKSLLRIKRISDFDFSPYSERLAQAQRDYSLRDAYREARALMAEYRLQLSVAVHEAHKRETRGIWSRGRAL